jgi:hypothetical protein
MAEVVDILHKLTFEADADVLQAVNAEFGKEIKQMNELKQKELEYAQLLEKTAQSDIRNRRTIEGLIAKNKAAQDALNVSVGKQFAANERLNTSLVKTGKNLHSLTFASAQLLREAPAFTYSIQTGILALSNNIPILIDQLTAARKAGSTTTEIFKALGQSIFSFTGILTIAVGVFTIFGDKIFNFKSDAEEAADAVERLAKETDNLRKEVLSLARGGDAGYYSSTQESVEKSIEADKRRIESMKARGAAEESIVAAENNVRRREIAQNEALIKSFEDRTTSAIRFDNDIRELRQKNAQLLNDITNSQIELERKQAEERQKQLDKAREQYEALQKAINEVTAAIGRIEYSEFEQAARDIEAMSRAYERFLQVLEKNIGTGPFDAGTGVVDPSRLPSGKFTSDELEAGSRRGKAQSEEEQKQADLDAKRKARDRQVTEEMASYAFNTTIQTLQSIYEAQLYYLDKEIAIRRERVDQATELAEKGNVEILEAEQDRLRKTEAERERVAQRQLQLNALLQASSAAIAATQAIQVVTNAGATGDPYSTAARIAAAVAALAAGFAFVTSLTQAFKFKDGVIGLDGPGNETSDSIPARLSKGESVMTAAETKRYRPYLEAMRAGTFNAMTREPVMINNKNDYGRLEKKLDGVIDAIEGNKITARQSIDKNGVAQIVETYSKHQARRWR